MGKTKKGGGVHAKKKLLIKDRALIIKTNYDRTTITGKSHPNQTYGRISQKINYRVSLVVAENGITYRCFRAHGGNMRKHPIKKDQFVLLEIQPDISEVTYRIIYSYTDEEMSRLRSMGQLSNFQIVDKEEDVIFDDSPSEDEEDFP